MSIRRALLPFEAQYTQMPNAWLRDERLSLRARGLLGLLMSHRVGWEITIDYLVRTCHEGRDAIRRAIRELEDAGYLTRENRRDDDNRFAGMDWVLSDPFDPDDSPSSGKPVGRATAPKEQHPVEQHLERANDDSSDSPDIAIDALEAPDASTAKFSTRSRRSRVPRHMLPPTWEPSETHIALAKSLGLNVTTEAEMFRDHAAANARILSDWDAGFRNWLRKSAQFGGAGGSVGSTEPPPPPPWWEFLGYTRDEYLKLNEDRNWAFGARAEAVAKGWSKW